MIHAFRMVMAPYALALHRAGVGRRIVQLDTDDIESSTLSRIAALHLKNGEPRPAAEARTMAKIHTRLERRLFPRFHRVFVCSKTDAATLRRHHTNIRVIPNIVPVATHAPIPSGSIPAVRNFRFLFVGTLDYYPNTDALLWLCREILPGLRTACNCELLVVGRQASSTLVDFLAKQDGVRFLGEMEHSNDAFDSADALLVPLRAGGGTRLKILEAFARGRPVVSTSIGREGLATEPGEHLLSADTPDAFIQEAARLVRDAALCSKLVENAFGLVRREYSPQALGRALADATA